MMFCQTFVKWQNRSRYNMAAQRNQFSKCLIGIPTSPSTPSNTILTESGPLHITPQDAIDSELEPNTPFKDPINSYKKKSGKLVSKRKLFMQSGQNSPVNKARRQATTKTPKTSPIISLPTDSSRPNFPLTERQQLQYLLEVTAREAKQDFETGSNSSDELPILYNRTNAKKDVSKENQIETRIRKRNVRGETALHVAAIRGDLEDVVALLKAGALVNAKDNAGWTPLHEACNCGNLSIVQELVQSGAEVNSPGYTAITPLHDAVINDHVEVVKYLLENGADPMLQTSQNYNTFTLARSEEVRYLLNPEERNRDVYSVEFQENIAYAQHRDPNFSIPEIKINGSNNPYTQRNNGEDVLVDELEMQDSKVLLSQSVSVPNPKDVEMELYITPQDTFGVNRGNCGDKQNFYTQQFPAYYDFPGNTYHCIDEREAACRRLPSKEGAGRNENLPVESDYAGWHFQRPLHHAVVAQEVQVRKIVQGVDADKINQCCDFETLTPHLGINEEACPQEMEPPIAVDPGLMNIKQLTTKKLGLPVTSEYEEDTVIPEKLNECLDKAMTEISSYLETSQKLDVEAPFDERESKTNGGHESKTDKSLNSKGLLNGFSDVDSPQKLASVDLASKLYSNNYHKEKPSEDSSLYKTPEPKEDDQVLPHQEVSAEETEGDIVDQQPNANFTKMKTRSERKKDGATAEKGTRSIRKKKISRSLDVTNSHCSQTKEECTSHIQNSSWRSDLPKYQYNMSTLHLSVPGFDDFLINSKGNGSKSFSDRIMDDSTKGNRLARLMSQHDTEKVKLRMTLEQELVRLYGGVARKSAGYQIPFSACTVISSQMRAPGIKLSVEKEPNISIKLEVDKILNKFSRLKTQMLNRHKREIETIFASESLWRENKTEDSRCVTKTGMYVSEDFDLLPPKFRDYYEEVLCAMD